MLHLGDFVLGGFDPRDLVHHRLRARAVAAGGDEGHVQFAQIFADEPARIAGRAIDDDGLLVGHDVFPPLVLVFACRWAALHSHAAVDRKPGAGDEPGRVGSEEHDGVRHVRDLAQPAERGLRR